MVEIDGIWYEEIFIHAANDGNASAYPCRQCVALRDETLCHSLPKCDNVAPNGDVGMVKWSVYVQMRG